MTTEQRITRIEEILLQVAQQQQQNTDAILQTNQVIATISQQQQQNNITIANLSQRLDQLAATQEQGFADSRQQLQESMDYLVGVVDGFVQELHQEREQAQLDRALMREMQTDVREMQAEVKGLQTETLRIAQYLFGQQPGREGQ